VDRTLRQLGLLNRLSAGAGLARIFPSAGCRHLLAGQLALEVPRYAACRLEFGLTRNF
jgi:hypothetical protein